jgi:hypothetical protein
MQSCDPKLIFSPEVYPSWILLAKANGPCFNRAMEIRNAAINACRQLHPTA